MKVIRKKVSDSRSELNSWVKIGPYTSVDISVKGVLVLIPPGFLPAIL